MPTITTRGKRLDLVLAKGKTFERYFRSTAVFLQDDGTELRTPFPLGAGSLRAQARKKLSDEVAAITFAVSAFDVELGIWRISLDAVTSAALQGGRNEDDPRALYEQWDVEFAYHDGRVIEIYYGELRVVGEATRIG